VSSSAMMLVTEPLRVSTQGVDWDLPAPHVVTLEVVAADIDAYDHVNNAVYLSWFDRVAWSHSASLGISLEECVRIRRGMAAHRSEIDYVRAAVLHDRVCVATWIVSTDGKLRVERKFQVRRAIAGETLARARTEYVCINLDSGRAARMPESFSVAYVASAGPT
jgi:acyl-CoA thioester hydrolase